MALFAAGQALAYDSIADIRQPVSDPCLMKTFASMLRYATGRMHGTEIAGFLVASNDESLQFQQWKGVAGVWRESYKGKVPEHVVAIVHTHPVSWSSPSSTDIAESVRIGLPIYVVSEWRIWVVDPESRSIQVLANTGWKRTAQLDQRCPQWGQKTAETHAIGGGSGTGVATGE